MCGIAGILRYDEQRVDQSALQQMARCLAHRGPDDLQTQTLGTCGLAHTRLAILDIADGRQPMSTSNSEHHGALTVVFNGEIYNHRELRYQLAGMGHTFCSDHSDTEVLLHGYRQWGTDLPKHLSGMFAFAIFDEDKRTLFLSRDRIGKKPLFYCDDGDRLLFASEIGALASLMRDRHIDHNAFGQFLQIGYCGHESLLAGVNELPPAHWMLLASGKRTRQERYWQPTEEGSDRVGDSLESLIEQAVQSRLEADVPLGCFLSGGIDSSLVAAFAQKALSKQGADALQTFSVRMPVASYDESAAAAEVAEHLGTNHTTLDAAESPDVFSDLATLVRVYGEPTADSSLLPTYWLSKATRQHVKTVLSGDGGDELFAGYNRYRAMDVLGAHGLWLKLLPPGLFQSTNTKSFRNNLGRLIYSAKAKSPATQYRRMVYLFSDQQIRDLLEYPDEAVACVVERDWPNTADAVRAARLWDLAHYLPMEVLRKVDRASMAVGLEVRCPLLDTRVCEKAMSYSTEQVMPGGHPKLLLRNLALKHLPASIVKRPKQGFALPIGQWLAGSLYDGLADHLMDGTLGDFGLRKDAVKRMMVEHRNATADHTHRLFALLQLSIWGKWIRDPQPMEVS